MKLLVHVAALALGLALVSPAQAQVSSAHFQLMMIVQIVGSGCIALLYLLGGTQVASE